MQIDKQNKSQRLLAILLASDADVFKFNTKNANSKLKLIKISENWP